MATTSTSSRHFTRLIHRPAPGIGDKLAAGIGSGTSSGIGRKPSVTFDKAGTSLIVDSETEQVLRRHPDLYLADGSVIVRAEDTLFRVHISMLARHSIFFRDVFGMPKGGEGTDQLDGCPVLFLQDRAEDVANLLSALYDGPVLRDNSPDDFRVVAGVCRLATKYLIDTLRVKTIAHLSKAWPSTLKEWDAREDAARVHEIAFASANPPTHPRYPNPVDVVNLAREVDAPSLLPSALYDLSRYPFTQIFEDQSASLDVHDLQRLCLGKEAAQHAITTLIQSMTHAQFGRQFPYHTHIRSASKGKASAHGSAVCMSPAACRKDFAELVELATQHYLFDRERGCGDPLYVAEELGQLKSVEFSECAACARSLEAWAAREREKMWKMIPTWFRLESPTPEDSPRTSGELSR
ncbi:hypothetical protein EV714DRAFT_246717 [Schizophyllum commune]